jgi:hypothetical protein
MKIFRFGLGTIVLLGVLTASAWLFLPDPATLRPAGSGPVGDTDDPRWREASAWVDAAEGRRLLNCPWPSGVPVGGSLSGAPDDAPAFHDDGLRVQGVEGEQGNGVVGAGGAVRAFLGWRGPTCAVFPPRTVRVQGRTVRSDGEPVPGVRVRGCGVEVEADEEGAFTAVLEGEALRDALLGPGGPRCSLSAGGPSTSVLLSEGGVQEVMVQVGVSGR